MIAVIQTGGKQFCVVPGKKLIVPRLTNPVGETVTFDNLLGNAPLQAEITEHSLGAKVVSRKFRNKTRYQRTKGHRQPLTVLVFKEGEVKVVKPAEVKAPKATVKKAKTKSKDV